MPDEANANGNVDPKPEVKKSRKGDETQRLEREVLEKIRRAAPEQKKKIAKLLETEIVRREQQESESEGGNE